jgi:hypothetical protein
MGRDIVKGQSEFVKGKSDSGHHGGTSVLEFGGTKEGTGVFGSILGGQHVPVVLTKKDGLSNKRSGTKARNSFLDFEEFLFGSQRGDRATRLGRGKGSGTASKTQESERKLHLDIIFVLLDGNMFTISRRRRRNFQQEDEREERYPSIACGWEPRTRKFENKQMFGGTLFSFVGTTLMCQSKVSKLSFHVSTG